MTYEYDAFHDSLSYNVNVLLETRSKRRAGFGISLPSCDCVRAERVARLQILFILYRIQHSGIERLESLDYKIYLSCRLASIINNMWA